MHSFEIKIEENNNIEKNERAVVSLYIFGCLNKGETS